MAPIIVSVLLATQFCGYLPNIENKGQFLTWVLQHSLGESPEAEAGTLTALLQHTNSDKERARAFVAWITVTLERYVAKIRKKEGLPFMVTYNLVLNFFFDMHLYATQTDWKSITDSLDLSILSDSDRKIFETILIPYLQEQPTVERFYNALKALYEERLADNEIKERMKAFFIRVCLPFFAWRLKGHVEKMNKNPYVVARAEQVQDYILRRYIKEQNRILMLSSSPAVETTVVQTTAIV